MTTPLRRLASNIVVCSEFLGQTGTIKDSIAQRAVENVVKKSKSLETIIVPSSGSFGVSVAFAATQRGLKCIAILPESVSEDLIKIIKPLPNVEIIRTPSEAKWDSPESPWSMATKMCKELGPMTIVVDEYSNDAGVEYAEQDLAPRIVTDDVDTIVVYAETGALLKGISQYAKNHKIKVVGVKPEPNSLIGSGSKHAQSKHSCVPDEWITIKDQQAYSTARRLIGEEGILTGVYGGATVAAGLQQTGKKVVCVLGDSARNYTSTLLNDDWLIDNQLADEHILSKFRDVEMLYRGASVEDLQLPEAVTIQRSVAIGHALEVMLERDFSQLPVIDKKRQMVGFVSLGSLQSQLKSGEAKLEDSIESVMYTWKKPSGAHKYIMITPDTPLSDLGKFFETYSFAFVTDETRRFVVGVVTKMDLLAFIGRRAHGNAQGWK